MAITNNLRIIMANNRIDNVTDLIKITGLSRNALNKLWHNENLESIKLDTLMTICDSLGVSLNDLITYEPDQK